ncbi:MAG: NAD(P)/FAD-dependent oxidoreductase [Anaerolineae bacterium]
MLTLGATLDLGDDVEQDAADVVIVGAGAAGLMAGMIAARMAPHRRIILLDGARKLGAKILVSGGGRCNVTHDVIDERVYAGSSQNAIKKVLRRFDVAQTIDGFRELGVTLKREETGKLFPTTDDAHTILEAMLRGVRDSGAVVRNPYRVEKIVKEGDSFRLSGVWGSICARAVILATGGKSLPKSGSDGGGYALARLLGHHLTPRIFPALVPLTLPRDHWIPQHSGISHTVTLTVRSGEGKALSAFTHSMLCTHFGISGPVVLDISRYWTAARLDDPAAQLTVNWLPDSTPERIDAKLQHLGKMTLLRFLSDSIPERLARALIGEAGLDPTQTGDTLTREARRTLTRTLTALPLPITGDRGFTYAEVTAGGVPLSEIRVETMESRIMPGLYLCGEICDVDGRIGGYNFQWAWSSGYVAGVSAARAVE